MTNTNNIQPPILDINAPPPYSRIDLNETNFQLNELSRINLQNLKLPTYEEVAIEKILNDEPLTFHNLTQEPFIADENSENEIVNNESLLGTDIIFVSAFLISFIFNWVGFLMLTCFCNTIAGRYGALSGFGLSLTKWTLIVKKSTDFVHSTNNDWLWWLIMTFGFLICIRALFQYLTIKRTWNLLSFSAQQRLLFFYLLFFALWRLQDLIQKFYLHLDVRYCR